MIDLFGSLCFISNFNLIWREMASGDRDASERERSKDPTRHETFNMRRILNLEIRMRARSCTTTYNYTHCDSCTSTRVSSHISKILLIDFGRSNQYSTARVPTVSNI